MGGPYKLKKRGKPMTTIYDAAILLVDDNPDLLTLVTDNLRTAGYKTVCTAADCAAARAAFASGGTWSARAAAGVPSRLE